MSDLTELPDLAAKRLGGMVLAANDEFFAPKENLLEPHPPAFVPNRFTDRGQEVDGWETRRRREPGHDWCVIRLGVPGIVRGIVVDTAHFSGNYPERCSLDGAVLDPADEDLALEADAPWTPVLPESNLQGDSLNEFAVDSPVRFTHLRFNIHPDGGVARLRVHGEPLPDLRRLAGSSGDADLAGLANGGMMLSASDRFFSSPHTLNTVGDARDMGDGWETRRRRGPGHDWVVLRLAAEGAIHRIEVDTTHFKGNHPESCSVEAARGPGGLEGLEWREAVPRTKLRPHARHAFDVADAEPAAHVRLNIFPDGGVARLRVHGRVTDDGWRSWGVRWLNARTAGAGEADLLACCGSTEWARRVAAGRPYAGFDELLRAATVAWDSVGPDGWREAFAAHPRIGEAASSAWSRQEQSGAAGASTETMAALAEGTRAYEERFGHVFLVDATGKRAEQMLSALRERLGNDPDAELRVAAGEQARITRIRLEKLVRS